MSAAPKIGPVEAGVGKQAHYAELRDRHAAMIAARTRANMGLHLATDAARRCRRMPRCAPPTAVARAPDLSQQPACWGKLGGRWADGAMRPGQRPARPGTGPSFGPRMVGLDASTTVRVLRLVQGLQCPLQCPPRGVRASGAEGRNKNYA